MKFKGFVFGLITGILGSILFFNLIPNKFDISINCTDEVLFNSIEIIEDFLLIQPHPNSEININNLGQIFSEDKCLNCSDSLRDEKTERIIEKMQILQSYKIHSVKEINSTGNFIMNYGEYSEPNDLVKFQFLIGKEDLIKLWGNDNIIEILNENECFYLVRMKFLQMSNRKMKSYQIIR